MTHSLMTSSGENDDTEIPAEVFESELATINKRRNNLGIPVGPGNPEQKNKPSVKRELVGLSLSGGGIRSSTFNLGVLQALEQVGLLQLVDYLSTVSGGGYIGSCLSSVLANSKQTDIDDIVIKGVPPTASLSHGSLLTDTSWQINKNDISDLKLQLTGGLDYDCSLEAYGLLSTKTHEHERDKCPLSLRAARNEDDNITLTSVGSAPQLKLVAEPAQDMEIQLHIGTCPYPFPFRHSPGIPESSPFQHLRDYSNYLAPNKPFAGLRMPALFIRGLLINCIIILPLLLFLAAFTVLTAKDDIKDALNTRQLSFPIVYKEQSATNNDTQYQQLVLDLRSRIEWDNLDTPKYITLSGLPRNSYAPHGRFLSQGRWLFTGEQAQKLRLTMRVPSPEANFTIQAMAWQSTNIVYLPVNSYKPVAEIELASTSKNELKVQGTLWAADTDTSGRDFSFTQPLLTAPTLDQLLTKMNIFRQQPEANRYLLLTNLSDYCPLLTGQRLKEGEWILKNTEMATLEISTLLANRIDQSKPVTITAWLSGRDKTYQDPVSRIYHSAFHYTGWLVLAFVFVLAISPFLSKMMPDTLGKWKKRDLLGRYLCGGGLAAVVIAGFIGLQPAAIYLFYRLHDLIGSMGVGGADKLSMMTGTLATILGGLVSNKSLSKGNNVLTLICMAAMAIMGPLVLWIFYLNFCGWALSPQHLPVVFKGILNFRVFIPEEILNKITLFHSMGPDSQVVIVCYLLLGGIIFIFGRAGYNINQTSIHPFYRDRLSKAFIFNWLPQRDTVKHNDEQRLQNLSEENAPYHILNATLNINGKSAGNIRGRNAEFFIFSRNYIGNQLTGYCKTKAYEGADPAMGLATAMSISAAAAAPNMGKSTNRSMTFIMALLNIRLGYWARNPMGLRPQTFWQHLFQLFQPSGVGPSYLIKEMLGRVNEKSKFINLSDGGHLENIGLYELVRRRCKFIIVCDSEADPKMTFFGFADAIRLIRIDMGIMIDINIDPIRPSGGEKQKNQVHSALGTIHYSQDKNDIGYLLYIKSSLSGDENVYIEDYKMRHPDFPHETTADQFFDEAQFEAYRALGNHIGRKIFSAPLAPKERGEDGLAFLEKLGVAPL